MGPVIKICRTKQPVSRQQAAVGLGQSEPKHKPSRSVPRALISLLVLRTIKRTENFERRGWPQLTNRFYTSANFASRWRAKPAHQKRSSLLVPAERPQVRQGAWLSVAVARCNPPQRKERIRFMSALYDPLVYIHVSGVCRRPRLRPPACHSRGSEVFMDQLWGDPSATSH